VSDRLGDGADVRRQTRVIAVRRGFSGVTICSVHLTASIQPPDDVIEHLRAALAQDLADTSQVTWKHPLSWRLRLANFGMVVRADALRVAECIGERIASVAAPTLRLEEVRPLPLDGDDSIWVGIGGDGDVLRDIAAAIPQWTHEIGFVPDRRAYYSGIRIGRVTPTTTAPYLESLVQRLGGYEGHAWQVTAIDLGTEKPAGPDHPPRFEPFQALPFATSAHGSGSIAHPVGDQHA
jgi:2'-5' RNA ligase